MMIELSHVTKVFNQGEPNEFTGVDDASIDIPLNRITCIQGPSGSGKTTLLSMIGCLSRPTRGRITLNNEILSGLPERFLAQIRQQRFGFIFQQFHLIRGISVLENVMLPGYPLGTSYRELKSRALELLDRFELSNKKNARMETLSGGEAQRAAICRALVNNPDIVIADEPTANLDSDLSGALWTIFNDLKDAGKTILIASHDPIITDNPKVDRHIKMRDGQIKETDSHAA